MAQFGVFASNFDTTLCHFDVDFSDVPHVDALQSSLQANISVFGKLIALQDNQVGDKT
jgi:hypothetical protein